MKIGDRALWLIENRLTETLTLAGLADELEVTAYHLARAFQATFGQPLMQYVRRRRLALAAQQLRSSRERIIDIAIAAGYGSQEAFARAFRGEFAQSPQSYRSAADGAANPGQEALTMTDSTALELPAPRRERCGPLRLIGLTQHYAQGDVAGIPAQWQRFVQTYPLPANAVTYGVCYNNEADGSMDYLCGVVAPSDTRGESNFDGLTVPEQTYAVFHHGGHISDMRAVWQAIWNGALQAAGLEATAGPEFERYGPEFDPVTGAGGYEIWIPVAG